MANALGIDLGNVYRTAEQIRSSRAARGANQVNTQNALATSQIQQRAASGQPGAMQELIGRDPGAAQNVLKAFDALSEQDQNTQRLQTEKIGTIIGAILQSSDPEAALASVRSQLPTELQSQIPTTIPELEFVFAQTQDLATLYDNHVEGRTATMERQNQLTDDATAHEREVALVDRRHQNSLAQNVAKAEIDATGGGVDTSASNAMFRQAVSFFGGTMDPTTGRISGLDPNQSARVQELTALSEQMAAQNNLPIAQAVQKAAEQLGFTVQGSNIAARNVAMNNNNPLATGPAQDPFNLGL